MTLLHVPTPPGFDLRATLTSHGWVRLSPFGHDEAFSVLDRTLRLGDGSVVDLEISGGGKKEGAAARRERQVAISSGGSDGLVVAVEAPGIEPGPGRREEIRRAVGRVFALDMDLAPFYTLVRDDPRYEWVEPGGEGRLLRSPSVWEDLAKILLTTNTTWAGTRGMVGRLTELGDPGPGGGRAFPPPARVAELSPGALDEHVRAGYRSPYLHELARGIAAGDTDVESWEDPALPAEELYRRVSSLRGFGPYAAGTALKLLGRFDRLALDSVARSTFAAEFNEGRPATDAEIRAHYEKWGEWRGLVLWMDVLRAHRS